MIGRFFHGTATAAAVLSAVLFILIGLTAATYPDTLALSEANVTLTGPVTLEAATDSTVILTSTDGEDDDSFSGKLMLWGIVPVKTVTVSTGQAPSVRVCGSALGIKLYTDGVLIVGLTPVDSAVGTLDPAAQAGLAVGDRILSINGTAVSDNEQVSQIVAASGGKTLTFTVERDGVSFDANVTPIKSLSDGTYHAGIWVRDSAAGIGMLTFYDPLTGVVAGLGHAMCDRDTGILLSVAGGELVPADIFDVIAGKAGEAGVLCGYFDNGTLGVLAGNTETGIYGLLTVTPDDMGTYEIAQPYEVTTGAAKMLCTVGEETAWYDVEIEKVNLQDQSGQSMIVRVTDESLLAVTGGIVQGMSGSPLVQNGRLIGAVTHVFVNQPEQGYAIFAQTMYESACQYAGTSAATLPSSIAGVTVSVSPDAA